MAGGYYVVLALGAVAMLGALLWPSRVPRAQPVRIKSDRSSRQF